MKQSLILTPKINRAIEKASILHEGKKRKDQITPYVSHAFAVALILLEYTRDEDVIIAGILHDTVEDTDYFFEEMEKDFGKRVVSFVSELTEQKEAEDGRKRPWDLRKQESREKLRAASSAALMIRAADGIHNLMSLIDAYTQSKVKSCSQTSTLRLNKNFITIERS